MGRSINDQTRSREQHGESGTRLYHIWLEIKHRTSNPNCRDYPDYGGRGIALDPLWNHSYIAFRDSVVPLGYSEDLSINRIDNDKDYEPGNVEWCTSLEQTFNKPLFKSNSSGYRGVYFRSGKWVAQFMYKGIREYSGKHPTKEAGALAYNEMAIRRLGSRANINQVPISLC